MSQERRIGQQETVPSTPKHICDAYQNSLNYLDQLFWYKGGADKQFVINVLNALCFDGSGNSCDGVERPHRLVAKDIKNNEIDPKKSPRIRRSIAFLYAAGRMITPEFYTLNNEDQESARQELFDDWVRLGLLYQELGDVKSLFVPWKQKQQPAEVPQLKIVSGDPTFDLIRTLRDQANTFMERSNLISVSET